MEKRMSNVKVKRNADKNKSIFKKAKFNVNERKSITKMMDRYKEEMKREWNDDEKVIKFSTGNEKTHMYSYSTMPGFTCMTKGVCPPCYTSGSCYAFADIIYPQVMENCVHNTVLLLKYPKAFEESLNELAKRELSIRLHVEGDFVNNVEVGIINRVARKNPNTHFLTYTKKYGLVNEYVGKYGMFSNNLTILFSKWDGWKMENKYNFPECHVYENVDGYLNASDERKCGEVIKRGSVFEFTKGSCAKCFLNHCIGNGKGGCFDMKVVSVKPMATAMLAH